MQGPMEIEKQSQTALRRRRFLRHAACLVVLAGGSTGNVGLGREPLFLGVTTSTENSGLLAHLIALFEARHDVQIRAVTAGSGAVMNLAARGDVDVILVHSPEDEAMFVAEGYGIDRRPAMRNRYVIVGPKGDPAGLRGADDAIDAFARLAASKAIFLSRGDESGTHKAERRLWQTVGIDLDKGVGWYRESGSGQGATLNIAANTGAYTLTDEATWATFGNPGELEALYPNDATARNDSALDNVYSIIRVNPERHAGLNQRDAVTFTNWLTSAAGRAAISSFKVNGRSLFSPAGELAG
ncbi:MAG: substrate-binding domain-containing protein [Pseudomonadota bacterium]